MGKDPVAWIPAIGGEYRCTREKHKRGDCTYNELDEREWKKQEPKWMDMLRCTTRLRKRPDALAAEERAQEIAAGVERWHYLSFATREAFLGGLLVRAFGRSDALMKSHELGLAPTGLCSVFIARLTADAPVPEGYGGRLLTKDEVLALDALAPGRSKN